jgi:hypothetical protein
MYPTRDCPVPRQERVDSNTITRVKKKENKIRGEFIEWLLGGVWI